MNIFSVASPALKTIFERLGKPEIIDQPSLLRPGGSGAVIISNHVGWADGLWLAYALYPRQLRFISKQELFSTPISKWVFEQSGCIAIDRADPSPSSIKTAVELLRQGELLLIFPSGTRGPEAAVFKRGAATIALHAQVPIVPAFYRGPTHMHYTHLVGRPRVQIRFGGVIATTGLTVDKHAAAALTSRLQVAIADLGAVEEQQLSAA
jgi:1-acyl-sn-glycerol-3-phosphate acyltransferase